MNWFGKIVMAIAVIIAIVASFVKFSYSSLILVILGLLIGVVLVKLKDLQSYVMATLGLALGATVLTYFSDIAVILGEFLTAIFGNLVVIVSSVTLALVLRYLAKYFFSK